MYSPLPNPVNPLEQALPIENTLQDKQVDNDGFFDAMEAGLDSVLSESLPSEAEIHSKARQELHVLMADFKKQRLIAGMTEWTASEQKRFFEEVRSEVENIGAFASAQMRKKIQALVEREVWREINDDGKKYALQDSEGNTMIPDMHEYRRFLETSFVTNKETAIIPLDLRLTIGETETVADAKKRLENYDGKYNALVYLDASGRPIGVVKREALKEYENTGHITMENVDYIEGVFGYYHTTAAEAQELMESNDIDILPIIDSNTMALVGILTRLEVAKKQVHRYYTTSLTKLSLDYLGTQV